MTSQTHTPKLDERTVDVSADRQEVVSDVMNDYFKIVETAIENGWNWAQNKSFEYGKVEQTQLQHAHNGVSVLMSLYQRLPEDHFFVDEERLRETVGLFICHDYHKMRDGTTYKTEFDIELHEAVDFIEDMGIDRIWDDVNAVAVRSVMAGHHLTNEYAKKSEVPLDLLDSVYFVLLADALASTKSVDESLSPACRKRVNKALGGDWSLFGHTLKRTKGETSMLMNRAMSEVMSEEGYVLVKVFEEGCLYLGEEEPDFTESDINKKVFKKFRSHVATAHPSYSLEAVESSNIIVEDDTAKFYHVGFNDILFRGVEDTIRGIVKQSVADSQNMNSVTETMKHSTGEITDIVEIDFHLDTRRVEGLASGVHTVYRQFTEALVTDDEEAPEWQTDRKMATLKVFGLYENEEAREKIKILDEWSDGSLEGGWHWDYKYPIAQFLYETHCTGYNQQELNEVLTDLVLDNLRDFPDYDTLEDLFIDDIMSEMRSYLGINVEVEGENISKYRTSTEGVDTYTHNPDKHDCSVCGWGTTAKKYENRLLDKDIGAERIETNVEGTGDVQDVSTDDNEPFCFMCQLEFSLRDENTEEWGDDDKNWLYAHVQPEYGFVPLSWWTMKMMMGNLRDYNDYSLRLNGISDNVLGGTIPSSVSEILGWNNTTQMESLTSVERAFTPEMAFGGRAIPIARMDDDEEVFEAVSVMVAVASYSGVRFHLSPVAMSEVKYNEGQLVSMDESVTECLPMETEGDVIISESKDFLRTVSVMEQLTKAVSSSGDSVFDSKMNAFETLSEKTGNPASRIACMASDRGRDVSKWADEIQQLDTMFGTCSYESISHELTMYLLELDAGAGADDNKEFITDTLSPFVEGRISTSNVSMWAENKAEERSTLGDSMTGRITERFADCFEELVLQSEMESDGLNTIRHQVGDIVKVQTHKRKNTLCNSGD